MTKPSEREPACGHQPIDHPADLALRLWAPTEVELLVEAGRAVVELLCGSGEVAPTDTRQIELDAVDAEDRLVRFMNEVLLLATLEGFLFARAAITLRDDGLSATIQGQAAGLHRVVAEIKAVTYHDVALVRLPGRIEATVVVDV